MRRTQTNQIKNERQDAVEIPQLAGKIVEADQKKVALNLSQQQPAEQPCNILHMAKKAKINDFRMAQVASKSSPTEVHYREEIKHIDDESVRGRFGWAELGKFSIPYIFRNGENYCAVRMVEMTLYNKYLSCLHPDLYKPISIPSYYLTNAECILLNEINMKHCEYQFGYGFFTTLDVIVRLSDANEFYNFLDVCYSKLVEGISTENDRCGFVRINKESVVAYTVKNNVKYLPLFYFESDTDNLKSNMDHLDSWDLLYLKFCCKIQGIRSELMGDDSCAVINLNIIKDYFPRETEFEIYWPSKEVDFGCLLMSNKCTQVSQWTQPLTVSMTSKGEIQVFSQPYPVLQKTPTTSPMWVLPPSMCQPSRSRYLRKQVNPSTTYNCYQS